MEHLKNYGIMCPSSATPMLNDENEDVITEDEYADNYVPVGGWSCNKDPTGRRNGRQPKQDMQDVILKALDEAKTVVSKVNFFVAKLVVVNILHLLTLY